MHKYNSFCFSWYRHLKMAIFELNTSNILFSIHILEIAIQLLSSLILVNVQVNIVIVQVSLRIKIKTQKCFLKYI